MNKKLGLLFVSFAMGAVNMAFAGSVPVYGNLAGTCSTASTACLTVTIPAGTALGSQLTNTAATITSGACTTAPTGWDGTLGAGLDSGLNSPLPGLYLASASCSISGTPTATTNGTQTVAIRNATSSTDAAPAYTSFWITVTPTKLVYPQNPVNGTVGVPVSDVPTINATGITNPITYSVSPALPAGLSISSTTGAITGSPTTVTAAAKYGVTASVVGADTHTYTTTDTLWIGVQAVSNYSAWKYSRAITINTSGMSIVGNVVNYPLAVNVSSANYPTGSLANGADIRFTATRNGKIVNLPYEIEQLDGSANGLIWVLLDTLYNSTASNAATQSITMYWGNSATTTPVSNGSAVFSPYDGFAAVYHMNADSTGTSATATNEEPDVTGNNLHADVKGTASTVVPSILGLGRAGWATTSHLVVNDSGNTPNPSGAQVFGAPVSSATPGSPVDFNTGADYTFSAWVNMTTASTSGNQVILSKGYCNNVNCQYAFQTDGGPWENSTFSYKNAATTSATRAAGEPSNNQSASANVAGWQYVVGTETSIPGTTFFASGNNTTGAQAAEDSTQTMQSLYVNAAAPSIAAGPYGGFTNIRLNTLPLSIGASADNQRPIPGTLDEVRLATVARSYDWIKADFQTQCQGATVGAYTGGATCVTGAITLGVLDSVQAPTIATSPTSQSTTVGSSVNFAVTATGSTPLVYVWLHSHGGTTDTLKKDTLSALTDTLKLTNVPLADTGSFKVVVSNSAGSVTSSSATLTLTAGPGITSSPASATVILGGNVKFGVSISGSSSTPLTYKWMHLHGGITDTLKKDTTSLFTDTLALTSIPQADTGSYEVFVSNSAGSATSQPGVLSIYSVPSAPTITSVKGASGQITVYWTTPASNGSAITGYKATSVQDTSKHCTSVSADSCIVTGLTNTTSYSFTVVATNAAGNSAPSTASTPTTNIFSFSSKTGFGLQMAGSTMLLHMPQVSGNVRVSILDMWGRTVWNRSVSGDIGQLTWNGNSNQGSAAPVGMYVLRLTFEKGASNPVGAIQTTFVKQ